MHVLCEIIVSFFELANRSDMGMLLSRWRYVHAPPCMRWGASQPVTQR